MIVRPTYTRRWMTALVGVAVAGISIVGTGCGQPEDSVDKNPPPRSYQLRGTVRQISDPGTAKAQVWIHHEAVPDFVGIDGKIQPMKAMTMPFSVSDPVDFSSLTPGTKVTFELTVDWSADVPGLITAIDTLPEDTVLAFETDH